MKKTILATAVVAALVGAISPVFADDHDNRRGHERVDRNDRHEGRGAGPEHSFYRGDRLPPDRHHRQYVVDDYRGHGLRAPPRGYHWVQSGSDYMLAAIATGIILDLALH